MSYATDGKCHNAEPGTFNHECGKPATWLGMNPRGYTSGFCDACKRDGDEASDVVRWQAIEDAASKPDVPYTDISWITDQRGTVKLQNSIRCF